MIINKAIVKKLKLRLPEYLKAIGQHPNQNSNSSFTALCPLHGDHRPSFSADLKEDGWVWYCHACRIGGSIIDLHADISMLNPKSDFKEICQGIIEWLKKPEAKLANAPGVYSANSQEKEPLSQEDLESRSYRWRETLYYDEVIRERFAASLGLPSELLKFAAMSAPNAAMGVVPKGFTLVRKDGTPCELREPRLVYIGDGYFKVRKPFGDGRDPRFWMVGRPRIPWLSNCLMHDQTTVRHVHIHESESSALALVASGFWDFRDSRSIVVATSGAGGFRSEWVPMFAGRTIHLWPDADEAGEAFVVKIAQLLHGSAKEILIHEWRHLLLNP